MEVEVRTRTSCARSETQDSPCVSFVFYFFPLDFFSPLSISFRFVLVFSLFSLFVSFSPAPVRLISSTPFRSRSFSFRFRLVPHRRAPPSRIRARDIIIVKRVKRNIYEIEHREKRTNFRPCMKRSPPFVDFKSGKAWRDGITEGKTRFAKG